MKAKRQMENARFVRSAGCALHRAAKATRKTAKMYGTPDLCLGKRQGSGEEILSFLKRISRRIYLRRSGTRSVVTLRREQVAKIVRLHHVREGAIAV